MQPLRFEPFFRPAVWGGTRIARWLGKNPTLTGPCGESWEVSDHPVHRSRLATAFGFGVTLRQLMVEHRKELLGSAADRFQVFPWLIKLLDANDWLSVQVHPDELAVKRLLPGEGAKTEAWLVLDAEPGGRVYAGLKPGVGEPEFRKALANDKITDCLHAFTPTPGDLVYLPAGTVHAVGGGVFLAEIQETSDATFRLFDWNRTDSKGQARPLHVNESLASIHWNQGPVEPIKTSNLAGSRRLLTCPYFQIDSVHWSTPATAGGQGRLQALIVTAGHGRFANGEYILPGDAWILPAAMPEMILHPDAPIVALLCTLP